MAFVHEKLDVYKEALAFSIWAETKLRTALKGRAHLVDQIVRASSSITFNIAEGANRWSRPDKKRFYQFAMGSTGECSAVLDLIGGSELYDVNSEDWIEQRKRLAKVAALTVGLLNAVSDP